jgi:hypothetical protein
LAHAEPFAYVKAIIKLINLVAIEPYDRGKSL